MERIIHVSCGWPKTKFMNLMEEISQSMGFETIFLPKKFDKKRIYTIDKIKLFFSLLNSGFIGEEEVVLFTDAYDAMPIVNMNELLYRFKSQDASIIVNAEFNCFPYSKNGKIYRDKEKKVFDEINSNFAHRYLNSGCYLGYSYSIFEMNEWIFKNTSGKIDHAEDQQLMQDYYLDNFSLKDERGRRKISLDCESNFFFCMNSIIDKLDNKADNFSGKAAISGDLRIFLDDLNKNPYQLKFNSKSKIDINSKLNSPAILHSNGSKMLLDSLLILGEEISKSKSTFSSEIFNLMDETGKIMCLESVSNEPKFLFKEINDAILENQVFFIFKSKRLTLNTFKSKLITIRPNGVISLGAKIAAAWELINYSNIHNVDSFEIHNKKLTSFFPESNINKFHLTLPSFDSIIQSKSNLLSFIELRKSAF